MFFSKLVLSKNHSYSFINNFCRIFIEINTASGLNRKSIIITIVPATGKMIGKWFTTKLKYAALIFLKIALYINTKSIAYQGR